MAGTADLRRCATVDTPEASPEARRFTLPPAHAEALLDADSPNWIAPLVVMPIGGMAAVLPQLVEAYRGRRGLPYAAYGEALRGGQAGLNRGVFEHHLPGWISRHLPDIDARLRVPGSSIADVACGSGLSTLALARMFPDAEVHGLDLDQASIRDAEANLAAADPGERLRDRVHFGAGDPGEAGRPAIPWSACSTPCTTCPPPSTYSGPAVGCWPPGARCC